ncbi:cysteinyl leukotriene receptor 1 [Heterodontus francisci]|uniref:cysteinyl leukotriene receptor 1 n=1 Tax=Heterodontus francisci TaxID=7792 RepID=UPI00355BEAE9
MDLTSMHANINCSNDAFKFPVFVNAYSVVLGIGLILNTIALYVFIILTRHKTASSVFMINLAVSDLFFILTLPYRIIYYSQGEWKLGSFLCRITTYAFYMNLYSSIFFLTALSIFRYVAVLYPVRSKSIVTLKRALWVSLGIWTFVALTTVPFLLASPSMRDGKNRCFEPTKMTWEQILKMNYLGLVIGFLLPFLTIIVCYTRIIQRLRGSSEVLQRNVRTRKKSVCMIIIVLSSFFFCFLPYHIMRTVHLHLMVQKRYCQPITIIVQKVIVVTICLAAANSCLNPLLYYFVGENFRNTIKASTFLRKRQLSMRSVSSGSVIYHERSPAVTPMAATALD